MEPDFKSIFLDRLNPLLHMDYMLKLKIAQLLFNWQTKSLRLWRNYHKNYQRGNLMQPLVVTLTLWYEKDSPKSAQLTTSQWRWRTAKKRLVAILESAGQNTLMLASISRDTTNQPSSGGSVPSQYSSERCTDALFWQRKKICNNFQPSYWRGETRKQLPWSAGTG